jgi:hypothetical protein
MARVNTGEGFVASVGNYDEQRNVAFPFIYLFICIYLFVYLFIYLFIYLLFISVEDYVVVHEVLTSTFNVISFVPFILYFILFYFILSSFSHRLPPLLILSFPPFSSLLLPPPVFPTGPRTKNSDLWENYNLGHCPAI